jgi:hypothetical protein
MTVSLPTGVDRGTALDLLKTLDSLKSLPQMPGRAEAMANGNALATAELSSIEGGQKIKIFYWFLANSVPPKHARLATFPIRSSKRVKAHRSSREGSGC